MLLQELYKLLEKAASDNKISLATFYGQREQCVAIIIPGSIDQIEKVKENENNTGLRKVLD